MPRRITVSILRPRLLSVTCVSRLDGLNTMGIFNSSQNGRVHGVCRSDRERISASTSCFAELAMIKTRIDGKWRFTFNIRVPNKHQCFRGNEIAAIRDKHVWRKTDKHAVWNGVAVFVYKRMIDRNNMVHKRTGRTCTTVVRHTTGLENDQTTHSRRTEPQPITVYKDQPKMEPQLSAEVQTLR